MTLQEIFKGLNNLDKSEITAEEHMEAIELLFDANNIFNEKPIYVEPPKDPETPEPDLPTDLPVDEDEGEDTFISGTEPGIEARLKRGDEPKDVAKLFKKAEAQEIAKEMGLKTTGTEVVILTRIQEEITK